jgi:toxin ParE1/3/4
MPDRRFRLARQAVADLNGIAAYLGERNPAASDKVMDTLWQTFAMLAENNSLGAQRDDLLAGLRIFSPQRPAHSYVIAYYKTNVTAVVHGARDWPNLVAGDDR